MMAVKVMPSNNIVVKTSNNSNFFVFFFVIYIIFVIFTIFIIFINPAIKNIYSGKSKRINTNNNGNN